MSSPSDRSGGRRRDFGSIRRLPSGRWQASYWREGERHVASSTFSSRGEASAHLRRVAVEIEDEVWQRPAASAVPFEEFARTWLGQRSSLSPRSVELYQGLLDSHILPAFGGLALRSISPAKVRTWNAELARRHPSTGAKAYRLLRQILSQAVDDDLLKRNPCRIKGAGVESVPRRPLITLEEAEKLELAMPEDLQLAVTCAVWLGLRRGEVLGLQRDDIDLERGMVDIVRAVSELSGQRPTVGPTKTEAGNRAIHLPGHVAHRFERHLRTHVRPEPDSLLFTSADGGLLRAGTFQRYWTRARQALGLLHVHFHDLRHLHLTMVATTGASLAEIMARAGQVSPRAALIYQHASSDRDRRIAEELSKMSRRADDDPGADLRPAAMEIAHGSRTTASTCARCRGGILLLPGVSTGAGDGNRTRVLSLGS